MIRALAIALTLLAAPVRAQDGHALFTGQAEATARHACHSCHGRDGQGGIEGDVPAIDGAHEMGALRRALMDGVGADGRALSRLMPRYALDDGDIAALQIYLAGLPAAQRRGVGPRRVRVGVMGFPGRAPLSEVYRAAVAAALSERLPGGAAYGRVVDLVALTPGRPGTNGVLAVVGGTPGIAAGLTAQGIPVIAPFGVLHGDEDRTILRGISASREVFLRTLAGRLTGSGGVRIETADPRDREALEDALLMAGVGRGDNDLVLLGGAHLPGDWQGARVWIDSETLATRPDWPAGVEVMLGLDRPALADAVAASGDSALVVHAHRAGAVLAEALKAAGRDVTRARLLQALEDAPLADLGLDYDRFPLTGTEAVRFEQIAPASH